MRLVVCEKPSVARDIAKVLGATRRASDGSLIGDGWTITWCVGHLIELEEPEAYDGAWKRWSLKTLPMVPEAFKLRPTKHGKKQWRVVRDLLRDGERRFRGVVNACDAGREGELIFRYVYQRAGSRLPIERLWISSMTDAAVRAGFASLKPGARYDALADAARCRSEADWLVGLNATRAMTLSRRVPGEREVYSIGRVQTPTLSLLVEREDAIRSFVPRGFWEVQAKLDAASARWTTPEGSSRLATEALARELIARAGAGGELAVESVSESEARERPPQLFDLTTLQREANRRHGFSAEKTAELAQALYERHKSITYPRTDSRVIGEDQRAALPGLLSSLAPIPEYTPHVARILAEPLRIGIRMIDDSKVSDHHAIIPTGTTPDLGRLSPDERRVLDLVLRRFLAAFGPDAVFAATEIVLRAGEGPRVKMRGSNEARDKILEALPPPPDRFVARGRVPIEPGWHAVEPPARSTSADRLKDEERTLPKLREGQRVPADLSSRAGRTQPPPRHSDATLLAAMETAGRHLEDETLRAAMKERGLGTPATRARIIETLIDRGYVARRGKALVPSDKGIELIANLPVPTLSSAELTGRWERRLERIARGEDTRTAFMLDIAAFVREVVPALVPHDRLVELVCPSCGGKGLVRGRRAWGCAHWRDGCDYVVPFPEP